MLVADLKTDWSMVNLSHDPNRLPLLHVLRLNVGGTIFDVTNYTLMRLDGSLLEELCRGSPFNWRLKDPDGNFFFDRDPYLFKRILSLYRTGMAIVPDHSLLAFHDEIVYWRLQGCVQTQTNKTGSQWWLHWDGAYRETNNSLLRVKNRDKSEGACSRLERAIEDGGLKCRIWESSAI